MKKVNLRQKRVKLDADTEFVLSFLRDKRNTVISNILTIVESKIRGEDYQKVRKVVLDNINELFRDMELFVTGEVVLVIEDEKDERNVAK